MSTLYEGELEQDDQDAVVLDARAGDLDSLKDIFSKLIHPKLLAQCKDSESGSTALHMAAANGHVNVVEYILETIGSEDSSSDLEKYVNAQNNRGNTALHWASLNGQLDVVKLLDQNGADAFMKNEFGHDAIFEAENNGKEEVEAYFLDKYDIQPQQGDETTTTTADIQIKEGTEIDAVTQEATEALRNKTEQLHI